MNAFAPTSLASIATIAVLLAGTVLAGLILSRGDSMLVARRISAWALAFSAVVGIERFCAHEPAGVRTVAICLGLLYAMKAIVSVEDLAAGGHRLDVLHWLAFALGWPGMRPSIFARAGRRKLGGASKLAVLGLVRLGLGVALIVAARLAWVAIGSRVLATVLLLPGLSLAFHFGVFNIVAGIWRAFGVDAASMFRAPLTARSLGEFWGRRWNLAFSEMAQLAINRPLSPRFGRTVATIAVFGYSSVVHELAISVPARGGYGLPSLYFALHGLLVLLERALAAKSQAIGTRPILGRAWTLLWLVLPLPLLFHRPFLAAVVWPLAGIGR